MVYSFFEFFDRAINRFFVNPLLKRELRSCGRNTRIGRGIRIYGRKNVSLANEVSIGDRCFFICTKARIIIGPHVMVGPMVTMITGGHRIDLMGKYMDCVLDDEKLPENDADIVIEGDNWLGANSTILKGVTIGKGSVVAAGSVVTRNVPPYSVVAGIPARVIKTRFTPEDVLKHQSMLCDE